ncbi:uncharacterized protein LTR77_011146 [Saxophila tyrrhenica]|uniref:BTB domain-containing protein n=1 Tax=Saxophila tyrrhenica TaxID=1690608 RepID=A0AAV9NX71_9PEZI|nr:hypothetical protein LTR77_011146 [Saxophila tyrrhenica]
MPLALPNTRRPRVTQLEHSHATGDVDRGGRRALQNLESLLQSGDLSDLTLTCQDRSFRVHKAVIHRRSPILGQQINQLERFAQNIEIAVGDSWTLWRALHYWYEGSYDDTSTGVIYQDEPSAAELLCCTPTTPQSDLGVEELGTGPTPSESHWNYVSRCCTPASSPQSELLRHTWEVRENDQVMVTRYNFDGFSRRNDEAIRSESRVSSNIARLQANVFVYIFASHYQALDLKWLAEGKFEQLLDSGYQEGLEVVCRLIYKYEAHIAADLRDHVSRNIAMNAREYLQDESFINAVRVLPEILKAAFEHHVVQQEATLEKNTTTIENLQDVIAQVSALPCQKCKR